MSSDKFFVTENSSWKLRYGVIFCGQALSLIGSALTQFVLIWWITDTTGKVSALANAGMVALLPHALLGPLGGTLADRYSRRFLMITSDLISALCMVVLISLFHTNSIELWHIYTMMFIRSSMQAFQQPAMSASTVMLVPESFVPRVAGLNQVLIGIMVIGAAPLGALAMSLFPIEYALSIDVVTAVLGVVPLLIFKIPQKFGERVQGSGLWSEFKEGAVLVWSNTGLRKLYILLATTTMVIMPSMTLTPLLVKVHFGGGAPQVALMEGLAGAGMILGGIVVAVLAPKRKIPWVLYGFSFSCFLVAFVALPSSNMFWLAAIFWGVSGLVYIMGNAPLTAFLQTSIPNQIQGRALSLLTTVSALAAPIGLLLVSPLGEILGIRWLFFGLGSLGGLVALSGFLFKDLLQIESQNKS